MTGHTKTAEKGTDSVYLVRVFLGKNTDMIKLGKRAIQIKPEIL